MVYTGQNSTLHKKHALHPGDPALHEQAGIADMHKSPADLSPRDFTLFRSKRMVKIELHHCLRNGVQRCTPFAKILNGL